MSEEVETLTSDQITGLSKALAFAKKLEAITQRVHDPNGKTRRRKNTSSSGFSRTDVENYLMSPTASEKSLRDASIYLNLTSSRYNHLLKYFSELPVWAYTITPQGFNPARVKNDALRRMYTKTCQILEKMHIEALCQEMTLIALREGCYYGVLWTLPSDKGFILQKLDPDKCSIVSKGADNIFNFAYDMSTITQETDLELYFPAQFRQMYEAYQNTGEKWQLVPPEIAFCLKADMTMPELSIPPFAPVMPALYYIKAFEQLAETANALENYKLLSLQLETDEQGVPTMPEDVVIQYYTQVANNLPEMIGLCLSPFKIDDHDFQKSGTATQVDSVSAATDNFFAAAGTSANLHGSANKTSAVTKLAIKVDEAFSFSFMDQCQSLFNRFLGNLAGTVKFKITFLPISIFNRDEMISMYKNSLNYGIGKLEYMACLGIHQYDLEGKAYVENDLLDLVNMFTILPTSSTQSATDESGTGRPEESESELSEEGEITRDNETNDNR